MADLARLNELYELCGTSRRSLFDSPEVTAEEALSPPPPPSLEALEHDLKRHRDRHAKTTADHIYLDVAIEGVEMARRQERKR